MNLIDIIYVIIMLQVSLGVFILIYKGAQIKDDIT
jgi:hypothetical protein